jgi:hypothetical protein
MRLALQPHPEFPPEAASAISVDVSRATGGELVLAYALSGRIAGVSLPAPAPPARTDELWRHTCFEAFVGPQGDDAYCEFNLAPSSQWAAYRFAGYRQGMADLDPIATPAIEVRAFDDRLELRVALDLGDVPGLSAAEPWRVALSAVIEERGGRKSYWALAHPPGNPDFHHPDSFSLALCPPESR